VTEVESQGADQYVIPGPPGIAYEATWGRKRVNSATFIARVFERELSGGMELWHCDHKHPSKATAADCARVMAHEVATRAMAEYRKVLAAMDTLSLTAALRELLPDVESVTVTNDDGTDARTYDLR
jgi:hypothetical protein